MKRRHTMPFGAELLDSGGVCFRLWAPGVATVALQLDEQQDLPMAAVGGGRYELTVPTACAGSRYRFRLPDGLLVPDPASRRNPEDIHGPSEVVDPTAFDWPDNNWRGRPWEEAVIYELHVGSFTQAGNFAGVEERLDYLVDLGVTALEIMPVADFPGRHNWGYDGVLPFAPDTAYGRPEDFKRLIAAAHARGLMVLLDVVYNHFGPEGNYLHAYAPDFFNPRHATPWGAAINFDGPGARTVRDFFIHNALYWLEEYHLDGLRLDAIHAICDDSSPDIVEELGAAVRNGPGRERQVHIVLENDRNAAHYLARDESRRWRDGTAQWNDDIHHTFHVLASGEIDGYYADYAAAPAHQLGRCLTEGFAFQNDPSPFRNGELRGESSKHLPPTAFINFLQTHDQIGNRAFGERLCHLATPAAMEAVTAVLLLAPQTPMLFMGEEFAAEQPFLFFCDFGPELARAVTEGRRREFAQFTRFANPAARERIPDPNAVATFATCVLDWNAIEKEPHRSVLTLHRQLLALRRQWIVPRLAGMDNGQPKLEMLAERALAVHWHFGDGSRLSLCANLGNSAATAAPASGTRLFATANLDDAALASGQRPPWSASWYLQAVKTS
ncbi:MAG: malto-oligosyltrehalose trehalohydrolase [Gammaproteobacteria bacterium]|nr:malto-oligosyltrehalose trehalohydrolase [Rhodocyclaceae bacterium]MBU3908558.1 malto-oligosyltrehalose trehalohydrolase [Gammaproteobacteria bacterium]MBU3990296.1 malto-oligosyltrehalose trehalohydrolase [Gammaproteobacteria bacterium]MBU4004586.1 malto-oligosyltrehalose trehalohydrolase [Gammaproteobacteria bacterium]MBU4021189.1 malto-oligosyltrehalose trehalohydrolase [Gammaproteobacteria bacterium]